MIETVVVDYLRNTLKIPAYLELPEKYPKSFLVIEKTGSGTSNFIESSTLVIQSYADRLMDAAELNERVKTAMQESVQLPGISRCRLNTDYNFTDTRIKKYRYQAVFNMTYLGGD